MENVELREYSHGSSVEGVQEYEVYVKQKSEKKPKKGGIITGIQKSYFLVPYADGDYRKFADVIYPVINYLQQKYGCRYRVTQFDPGPVAGLQGVVLEADE